MSLPEANSECQALIDMIRVCIYCMSLAEQGPVNMANLASVGRTGGGRREGRGETVEGCFSEIPSLQKEGHLAKCVGGGCSERHQYGDCRHQNTPPSLLSCS